MPDWNKRYSAFIPMIGQAANKNLSSNKRKVRITKLKYRILLPDGAVRHIQSVGHPVLDPSGDLVQFLGSSTDITERRRPKKLCVRRRLILPASAASHYGELTASFAHEVNQPIAAAVTDANTCLRWLNRANPIWKRRERLRLEPSEMQPVRRKSSPELGLLSRRVLRNGGWLT